MKHMHTDLTGVGDISAALCDMYVDGVQDVAAKFRPTTIAYFAGDTAKMVGWKADTFIVSNIHISPERTNGRYLEGHNARFLEKL
jgi:hypothetical protein